jgi:PIN domain nuclease of toxin-antitoxin system
MRVLLDTVAFLLAMEAPHKLSREANRILSSSSIEREISVVSFAEIAIKHALGKMSLNQADIRRGAADLDLRILPLSEEHAMGLFDLPLHHTDPFDRQLIAQAMVEKIPIVTCDTAFERYRGLKVIW